MTKEALKWIEKCARAAGDASTSRLSGLDVLALLAERNELLAACKAALPRQDLTRLRDDQDVVDKIYSAINKADGM